ncbi:hypothetical protein B9Z65_8113 [Elsinoe australis]|uniref:NAD(P)-binding protein n=1 Tax=Elsinoe australis TaxID=40998 RepID=A0A2P7YW28_9PEZI|nr:hypothetical protein B9Z65_8113 [Elsinoe australis]
MSGFLKLFKQKLNPPVNPTTSFAGKIVLVTGANIGLGYEASLKFHRLGASRLILAVRNLPSGQAAARKIRSLSPGTGAIDVWPLDMLSYPSIQSFAKRVSTELPQLDIAILNAGIFSATPQFSDYGYERTLQVNTLSTVLLALLLLPKLRSSKPTPSSTTSLPVLELVSSGTHVMVKWDPELRSSSTPLSLLNNRARAAQAAKTTSDPTPAKKQTYAMNLYYGSSKLLLMCALAHLSRLGAQDVLVTSVCPGLTKTRLARDVMRWWLIPVAWLFYTLFGRTGEQGARTVVSGVTLGDEARGGFWQHDILQPTAPLLDGKQGRERTDKVWFEIVDALRRDVEGVMELTKGEEGK